MKLIRLFAVALALLSSSPAIAQTAPAFRPGVNVQDVNPQPVKTMCYTAGAWAPCPTSTGSGGTVTQSDPTQLNSQVVGNVASGTADAGNPVKMGGVASSTAPTAVAAGQRVNSWFGLNGQTIASLMSANGSPIGFDNQTISNDGINSFAGLNVLNRNLVSNGTTWDRQRGDVNGTWSQGNVASGVADAGNPQKMGGVFNTTPPTVATGQRVDAQFSNRGEQLVALSVGGAQMGGTPNNADAVATFSGNQAVRSAGFNYVFNGSTWDRSRGDTSGAYMVNIASAVAAAGVVPSSSAVAESGRVAKASAGNVFGVDATSGASAGYVMLFNSTTVPADGTVAPVKCWTLAANSSASWSFRAAPAYFSTGIAVAFSTSGCFTKTASATAFLSVDAK